MGHGVFGWRLSIRMLRVFKAMLYDQESIALTPLKRCFILEEDILVKQKVGNRK